MGVFDKRSCGKKSILLQNPLSKGDDFSFFVTKTRQKCLKWVKKEVHLYFCEKVAQYNIFSAEAVNPLPKLCYSAP